MAEKDQIIHQLTYYDSLTGLPNRAMLKEKLSTIVAQVEFNNKFALLVLDLDNFKCINDSIGHDYGDYFLINVARNLEDFVPSNATVARLGGDDFMILIEDIADNNQVVALAEKIVAFFNKPFVISKTNFLVTASIGIALFPNDGTDGNAILKHADIAKHRVKETGGNSYRFFTQELNDIVLNRLSMETSLRQALAKEEFYLVYQPIIDLSSNKIIGVEALIRWDHPEKGIVSPGDFIPIAEKTGFIIPLSKWVLETACTQNKAWQNAGLDPIFVSVNLSARQFQSQDIAKEVADMLTKTQLKPQYLKLELTETIAIHNLLHTIETLTQLQEMGVSTSLDDFGTGYSSLNYLRLLNVSTIKIDKSFISNIMEIPIEREIVKAVISLAHGINLKVTAEGVETERQLSFLRGLNCDTAQGFFFNKPLAPDEIAFLLQQTSYMPHKKLSGAISL